MKSRAKRKYIKSTVFLAFVISIVTGACMLGFGNNNVPGKTFEYPRVDGSTSTHPLDVILACEKNHVPWAWVSPGDQWRAMGDKGPELRATPIVKNPRDVMERDLAIIIKTAVNHNGTDKSYAALISKQADLILVARAPSPDEMKLARERGVEFEMSPVAHDALVFVVNINNPTANLSTDQLRGIYTNKIKRWEELGWGETAPPQKEIDLIDDFAHKRKSLYKDMEVVPYTRNRNSGSKELLDSLLMKGVSSVESLKEPDPKLVMMEMFPVIDTIAEDKYGICYTVYYYEEFMYKSNLVKTISVDNVPPTAETIGNGKYPFVADVYAVVRKDEPAGSEARKLLNWILSDEGQKIVAKSGYVPVKKQ